MSSLFDLVFMPERNKDGTFVHPDVLLFYSDEEDTPKWRELEDAGWRLCFQWLDPNLYPYDDAPRLSPFKPHGLDSSYWSPAIEGWRLVGIWNGNHGVYAAFVQPRIDGFPKNSGRNWQLLTHVTLVGLDQEHPTIDDNFMAIDQSSSKIIPLGAIS